MMGYEGLGLGKCANIEPIMHSSTQGPGEKADLISETTHREDSGSETGLCMESASGSNAEMLIQRVGSRQANNGVWLSDLLMKEDAHEQGQLTILPVPGTRRSH